METSAWTPAHLQAEMSGYLKSALLVKSMVTNGNEGYRTRGIYDPYASVSYPYLNWCVGIKIWCRPR